MKRWLTGTLCAVLLTGACTQDSPTETGSGLLPPDAVRTFEVILGPERWLQWDTAFNIYSSPSDADFLIIANQYEGTLNSRALLRYQIPRTIVVRDSGGTARVDSFPRFFEGELRFLADTVATTARPITLEAFRTTESWDRTTATWNLRVDSGSVQLPWAVPGGSPGALFGSGTFSTTDTIVIPVDSATLAVWADTTNETRGAVIASATAGSRLRTVLPTLRVRARGSFNPDTVVELNLVPGRTFIFTPETPRNVSTPRVGGTPAYRTIARMRDRLDTVTVACPGVPGCTVRLGSASINYAAVQLQPVPAPAGFAPELPTMVALHPIFTTDLVPLERSPVLTIWGQTQSPIPVSSFTQAGAPIVPIPVTEFVREIAATPTEGRPPAPTHFALITSGTRTFGFGTFAELPSLRLIISVARELQLP